MTTGRSDAVRLALLQGSLFAAMAIQLPFWPLFLASRGLTASAIGQVLAVSYAARILSNPTAGWITDRTGQPKRVLIALAVAAFLSTLLFIRCGTMASLMAVTLFSAGAYSAMLPMTDNLTMLAAQRHGFAYGRVRLWGSLSFIVVTFVGGRMLIGIDAIWIWITLLVILAANSLATIALPAERLDPRTAKDGVTTAAIGPWHFGLFVLTAGLCQASHILYYGFGTLHWQHAGLSGPMIGFLWCEAVIAEVCLFAIGDRLMRRLPPLLWIAAGAAAGLIRWSLLAVTTDPWLLAPAQLLHAFTYAAVQLGAMHFIARGLPAHKFARAQGIYYAMTGGLAPAIVMNLSGRAYDEFGGHAFFFMAGLSAAGLILTAILLAIGKQSLRVRH